MRVFGFTCLACFTLESLPLAAQDSNWTALLEQADKGEASLQKILEDRPEAIKISSQNDLSAILDWTKAFDATQPMQRPNQITNLETLLNFLIDLRYSGNAAVDTTAIESELEQKVRRILTLPENEIEPMEKLALRIIQYIALCESKRYVPILLSAAEDKRLQNSESWHDVIFSLPNESPAFLSLQEKVLDRTIAGRIAVSLVDWENQLAYGQENYTHFLNRIEGDSIVREWLSADLNEELKSTDAPKQAAISLAFLQSPNWLEFIELARRHPDVNVVLEGAWAGARRKHEESISQLVELAKDVRFSQTAVQYLDELQLEDRIPEEVRAPEFIAKAELARWLTYPTVKGRPPDQLEIIDRRSIPWPLEAAPVNAFLIQFTYKDPTGTHADEVDIGMAGPSTSCHFDMKMTSRSKEDIYAIHVFRELESYGLIESVDLALKPGAFDYLLKVWKGEKLDNPKIVYVAKLEPAVEYPRRLVALATATKNGEEGFVVLDGPRSKWFPKKDQIPDTPEAAFLMIHLGRQINGL